MTSDSELVERARVGDAGAAEALVKRHLDPLWRFAMRYLMNPEDASDAAQEVWLRIFRALPTFRPGAAFAPWFWRIAANVCADMYRRRSRMRLTDEPPEDLPDPSGVLDPEAQIDADALSRALERLPDRYRRVVELRHTAGLSVEETARVLGVPVGTVKTRLHRARERLRKSLGRLKKSETFEPPGS